MARGAHRCSPETIAKLRAFNLGRPSGMLGKHQSEEARMKMSESHRGKPSPFLGKHHSEEAKRKNREAHLGKPGPSLVKRMSEETKRKISEAKRGKPNPHIGYSCSEESRRKMSAYHSAHPISFWAGKHLSEEHRRKQSEALSGEKSYLWRGGISSIVQYPSAWTGTLRREIRERDSYTCQLCGKLQDNIAFDVHHIDYNKKHCERENLVTLCRHCHRKTNHNREHWTGLFSVSNLR